MNNDVTSPASLAETWEAVAQARLNAGDPAGFASALVKSEEYRAYADWLTWPSNRNRYYGVGW